MTFVDPIGDMITRIRNAQMRSLRSVNIPSSKFRVKILDILNVNKTERNFDHITISTSDYKISDPKPIFPRID